ncbi:MAG: tetratricopeptide repeat protein [Deltaproteobacteria bacterium]|nr:tetratricopeptide repeat protein [Deltaproteobacteria bacterium]
MSSIYDALKRLQAQREGSSQDMPYSEKTQKASPAWMKVVVVLICVVCGAILVLIFQNRNPYKDIVLTKVDSGKTIFLNSLQKDNEPSDINVLLNEADINRRSGNLHRAIGLYYRVLEISPEYIDAYIKLGGLYFDIKEYDKALSIYKKALIYSTDDARVLNNIGGILLAKGNLDTAVNYFERASRISDSYVEPVYNMACAYARKGDKIGAINALEKAFEMYPDARTWARQDPDFEGLKGDESFDSIVEGSPIKEER